MCSVKPQTDLSHKGRAVEEWADLHFFRPIGIRIARALQRTGISADQVTLWSLAIGLVAGHLFAYRDRWTNAIGFVLFIVSDIFDSADGQLARLRGSSTRFGRALDGISDNLRFVNLYFHLIYRLIHSGFWGPGAFLLVAAAGLAHTFQSAAIDFVRNAFLYIGVGNGGELDLPEDLDGDRRATVLQRFGARVYRDYVERQVHLFPRSVKLIRLLRRRGVTDAFRAEYRARQEVVLPLCAWLGQNIRFVLVGVAAVAAHLPALRGAAALTGRVEVVALVDSAGDVPPVDAIPLFGRREQLRDLAPLDFIDICTPTASHLELTLWGLEQGYHVVCEKPVALTRGEAERIAAAARTSGRIVMPCHQYRHNPVWMKVKEWLASGAIGRWHLAEFSVYRTTADPGRVAGGTPWRGTSAAGRGGVLLDHGTHLVYQLLDIAGMPASVSAWTGRLRHARYEVEDTASLRFDYPGRLVTMFFTWAAQARENRIRFVGDEGAIEWTGGELRLERAGAVERLDYSAELEKTAYHRWFAGLFEGFVAALDRSDPGAAAGPFLEDIRRVASVVEHAYIAARNGATVAISDDA